MYGMKKMKADKNLKSSLITYGMVIAAYVIMQTLVMTDNLSSLLEGLLVPLCIYSIMAVSLNLTVDTQFSSVMDYFEIFMERMLLCRKAADRLGLQFKLIINDQRLG